MRYWLMLVGLACAAVTAIGARTATVAAGTKPPKLSVGTFKVDVTPPLGAPLCDALCPPAAAVDDPLSARGVVLIPAGEKPIVLVALDWVGVGNDGQDAWKEALAAAAGTTADRVAVHALHQHDAPGCDFGAEKLASEYGLGGKQVKGQALQRRLRLRI